MAIEATTFSFASAIALVQLVQRLPRAVMEIRAAHKLSDREAAIEAFNDKSNPAHCLITSQCLSSTEYNIHNHYSDVVFTNVPSSALKALQAGGRVLRMGQTRICHSWVRTDDHTYDQILQTTATKKIINIIAGQGNIKLTS